MKKLLQIPLLLVALFLTSIPISAHNFEVDGIYYNITNSTDKTVAVTYRGYYSTTVANEYTGSVVIPETVTYSGKTYSVFAIDNEAFYGCTGLTEVSIPNSVTSIGSSAFSGCNGLTTISIPNSVTSIGGSAFEGCTGLTEVNISDLSAWCKINFGNISANPLYYAKKLILNGTEITNLVIPNDISKINNYAFYNCSSFTSITIPNSVTSIGSSAFYKCTSLTEVNISDLSAWCKIKFGNISANPLYYANKLKLNGTEITNLVIPNDIFQIKYLTFYGCTSLTSVTIPNSVTSIGDSAFEGCTGLTGITIPNSVTSIGDSAFEGCTGLTGITIPNSVTKIGGSAFEGCTGLTGITIPNSVTEIGPKTFQGCTCLTSVSIPNSVIKIGESAFENCSNLTNANIGSALKTIGRFAFSNCGLTEITIPTTTIEIGGAAFRDCNNLKVINYNAENCEYSAYLSYVAFGGCHSLQTLNIGNSVKSIPEFIFGNLPIKSLTLPNSVTDIGYYAFKGCSNLTTLKIPNSTNISPYAFIDCSGLLSVYNKASSLTTVTLNISNRTNYGAMVIIDKSFDNVEPERIIDVATGTAIISELTPGAWYSLNAILAINAVNCVILENLSVKTQKIGINFTGISGVTKIDVSASFSSNKDLVDSCGFIIDHQTDNKFDNFTEKTFVQLDPNTEYVINFGAKNIAENVIVWSTPYTFTTGELVLTTQEAKPTSTTSVRLLAATNCDATEGTGFEWRRYDAPEEFPSSKVSCPVVDGVLVGTLRGVKDDVYYKYRPYYTSSSGNTYYGDWVAFFTGDANVYFEPEVRTYEDIQVINNSATVKGYALEGTDVITAQGFEYWKTGTTIKPASTDDRMTVNASGISMRATLANLEYNSTYKYRAFVTTAKGTTYGDEVEFSTGDDPAGIGYIEVDGEEFSVTLRENPATGTAWVKILGVSGNEAQYVLTSISGAMVANGTMMLDGEWNAIELNCSAGMYLLTINDGSQVKTLRLIVK